MKLLTKDVKYEVTFYDENHNKLKVGTYETAGRADIIVRETKLKFTTYRVIKITTTIEKEVL